MIEISLTLALTFYSLLIGAGALAIWLYTELRAQHVYRVMEHQHLWRCVYCSFTYLDEAALTVSQCPRCGSFNAIDDKHARLVKAPKAARATRKEARQAERQRKAARRRRGRTPRRR